MKLQSKNIEKFLKNGEINLNINELEEDLLDDNLNEEFEISKRVNPMRSAMTKNKKQDASMYKNLDAKRYHKKK